MDGDPVHDYSIGNEDYYFGKKEKPQRKGYLKYAIARFTDNKCCGLVSLLVERPGGLTSYGFHRDGYTTPDFRTFDDFDEAWSHLAQNDEPERAAILGVHDMVVMVEDLRFDILVENKLVASRLDAQEYLLRWLIIDTMRGEDHLDLRCHLDCPGFFAGRIATLVNHKDNTWEPYR